MATITNDAVGSGSITNDDYASKNKKWSTMTKTWDDYDQSWNNPQDFKNDSITTPTITNDAHTD